MKETGKNMKESMSKQLLSLKESTNKLLLNMKERGFNKRRRTRHLRLKTNR
jgi:hypothetical protein